MTIQFFFSSVADPRVAGLFVAATGPCRCTSLVYRSCFSRGCSCISYLKGTVVRDFLSSVFFSWIYSTWAPDFEAKRIFVSFAFSRSYSNFSVILRSVLLRGMIIFFEDSKTNGEIL